MMMMEPMGMDIHASTEGKENSAKCQLQDGSWEQTFFDSSNRKWR
jgi:hypothetical protein